MGMSSGGFTLLLWRVIVAFFVEFLPSMVSLRGVLFDFETPLMRVGQACRPACIESNSAGSHPPTRGSGFQDNMENDGSLVSLLSVALVVVAFLLPACIASKIKAEDNKA